MVQAREKRRGETHKLITITKRQAENPQLYEARTVRGEERMRRAGKRRDAQLGESKYNYTKVSRNTETESRGNRRVSLKLESCFETARLPCRLQPRHRRALPFPNSRPFASSYLRAAAVPWKAKTKRNFRAACRRLLRKNYVTCHATTFNFCDFCDCVPYRDEHVYYVDMYDMFESNIGNRTSESNLEPYKSVQSFKRC